MLLVWEAMEGIMARDSELVFWLPCGVVIICRSILEIGGCKCMIVFYMVLEGCGEGVFG